MSFTYLRLYYFVMLGALAGVVPFLGARLEAAHMDGVALGVVMAGSPIARLLVAPLWSFLADRSRMAGLLLRASCAVALAGHVLLWKAESFEALVAGALLLAGGRAPFGPLVDGMILESLRAHPGGTGAYGTVRLFGSLGFLVVAFAAGLADERLGIDPLAIGVGFAIVGLGMSFAFPLRGEGGPAPLGPALRALAADPLLPPFLVYATLQGMTLSVYDSFFSLHTEALGLGRTVVGGAVASGVAVEVLVMAFGGALLTRLGPARMLAIAALAAIPRWLATAWVTDPIGLVAIQASHGISFGFFWIGGVQWMAGRAPRAVSASGQAVFTAAGYALGNLFGALLAGLLRREFGSSSIFLAMAVASTVAALVTTRLLGARARPGQAEDHAA